MSDLGRLYRRLLGHSTIEDYVYDIAPYASEDQRRRFIEEFIGQAIITKRMAKQLVKSGTQHERFTNLSHTLQLSLIEDFGNGDSRRRTNVKTHKY